MTTHVPGGTSEDAVAEVRQREAAHSHDLAEHGNLLRLWRPPLNPGEWRTLGLFAARDADELETVLASMPLRVWRTDENEQLSPHPNDPALSGAGRGHEFLVTMALVIPDGRRARSWRTGPHVKPNAPMNFRAKVTCAACGQRRRNRL